MNRIRQKLTSQSGASITYALLLFLVCAVVSSVVLAAGTAAAGRMSKAVENDKRFYNVSGAAEYLKKLIDGKTVTIRTSADTDPVYKGAGGNIILENISMGAEKFAKGESVEVLNYTLSAGEEDDTVSVSAKIESFSGTASEDPDAARDPKLTLSIFNPDEDVRNQYVIELAFTASVDPPRTLKGGVTSQKVRWNIYSIHNGSSQKQTEGNAAPGP